MAKEVSFAYALAWITQLSGNRLLRLASGHPGVWPNNTLTSTVSRRKFGRNLEWLFPLWAGRMDFPADFVVDNAKTQPWMELYQKHMSES